MHDSLWSQFLFSTMYMSYVQYDGLSWKVTLRSCDQVVFGCSLSYQLLQAACYGLIRSDHTMSACISVYYYTCSI
jgi:hypothetical protein